MYDDVLIKTCFCTQNEIGLSYSGFDFQRYRRVVGDTLFAAMGLAVTMSGGSLGRETARVISDGGGRPMALPLCLQVCQLMLLFQQQLVESSKLGGRWRHAEVSKLDLATCSLLQELLF